MSVSPRQNFLKPPPVPEMPTVTLMALVGFLELLGDRLRDRKDGAGTVDRYGLGLGKGLVCPPSNFRPRR